GEVIEDGEGGGGDRQQQGVAAMRILLFGLLDLLVRHGCVAGPELDEIGRELPNPWATTDCLIVDPDIRMSMVVFEEPALVERRGKRRPGSLDIDAVQRIAGSNEAAARRSRQQLPRVRSQHPKLPLGGAIEGKPGEPA